MPKTIDNDLTHTDHTPGFGSAAKYVATSVKEMGKVMGVASKRLAGQADGKDISAKVRELLG